ncbi:MAG: phosphohistidine phosphatase SixA [Psychromonas sp.]|nr:phosphohistidine phosphatase SixA [Psychromonas sp.]
MKTLYFVQHGIAESKDIDPSRPLSDIGRSEVKRIAGYLRQHKIVINKIFHSGKLRAQQTAVIFSQILNVDNVYKLAGMQPNAAPAELIEQITEDAVMYIGHLPNIQHVVAQIVANNVNCSVVKFQNSAVICIEMDENGASIRWFITPEMC